MRQGRQLALRYDGQITSVKPTVNRQKIDTLGGRFPKFAENANLNYREFAVSALITAEEDFNRKFMSELDYLDELETYNDQMDGKFEVRNDTITDTTLSYRNYSDTLGETANTLHDIYPKDNWWWERKFRDEAVTWLNDGEPKLFRSMTEGNMLVMFTNVSLSPMQQLGRRLYKLTATMYEIGDGYDLDELDRYGVITRPDTSDITSIKANAANSYASKVVVGQSYNVKFGNGVDVLNGTIDPDENVATTPIVPVSIPRFTIADALNSTMQGIFKDKEVKFIPLTNVKIQFTSKPQYYDLISMARVTNPEEYDDISSLSLGYDLMINNIPIFVNERGYYQVPEGTTVESLTLGEGEVAVIDYKLHYKEANTAKLPRSIQKVDNIIGQWSGAFSPDVNYGNRIRNKYSLVQAETQTGETVMAQQMQN